MVLLLDEPLSNLDAKLRVEMRGEIRRLQKLLGITVLYVTHDSGRSARDLRPDRRDARRPRRADRDNRARSTNMPGDAIRRKLRRHHELAERLSVR